MKIKHIFILCLWLMATSTFGQAKVFRSTKDFSNWEMDYYKNPQPQFLQDAFEFAVQNKEIKASGSRNLTFRFFASCMSKDTLKQAEFFALYKNSTNDDFVYGYAMTLLMIHSDYSLMKLGQFINLPQTTKYKRDFEKLMSEKYVDIWSEPVAYPQHLDMLWADFFATGSEKDVEKIIGKLSDIESTDYNAKMVAGSAKWSLTANAIRHDVVFDVCKKQVTTADDKMKKTLNEIISSAEKQRKR
jgi:hypothetical protein